MANLDNYTKSFLVQSSTAAFTGSTGDALGFSTAQGFPFGSTVIDTAGFEGVMFTAIVVNSTYAALSALGGQSSGSSTGYNALTGSTVIASTATASPSTVKFELVLDLYRPRNRWVAALASVPTTSGYPTAITAVLYGAKKEPPTNDASVANTTATISVSPSS